MDISSGVLILNERRELFMAHVTGTTHWDIPKGLRDDGEHPLDAAVRETAEETGLLLDPENLIDLGEMDYLPRKRLHLFAMSIATSAVDPDACRCTSMFRHWRSGKELPEADRFAWVPSAEVREHCAARMGKLLVDQGILVRATELVGV